jgi:hypothetical protein
MMLFRLPNNGMGLSIQVHCLPTRASTILIPPSLAYAVLCPASSPSAKTPEKFTSIMDGPRK